MPKYLVAIVLAIVLLFALLFLSQSRHEALKVSGVIEADEIRLGSRIGGRVKRVLVVEGQTVGPGEVLVELEPFDLIERRAQAVSLLSQRKARQAELKSGYRTEEIAQAAARVDQAKAVFEKLRAGPREQEIGEARHQMKLSEAELTLARLKRQRLQSLYNSGFASKEDLDEATRTLRVAEESLQVRKKQLDLLEEGTRPEEIAQAKAQLTEATEAWKRLRDGFRKEQVAQAEADVQAAEASLGMIQRQIEELQIRAPSHAIVEACDLQAGDIVLANAPILSLMDDGELWVRTYVPENRLDLRLGEEVAVSVDSFPGIRFRGRISFIARQSEFTPGNVQTPEERSKQVFRVKVTMLDGHDQLRPGMSADVWLGERQE